MIWKWNSSNIFSFYELEKEYGVEIEVIEKEVGEAEKVEVIVYDFTRELVIEKHEFEISNKRQIQIMIYKILSYYNH